MPSKNLRGEVHEQVKIAVLGTGSAGSRHLETVSRLNGTSPVAVPVRRSRLAELEEDGLTAAPDIRSAVSHGVTGAIVATDTARHASDAISAMELGLDILVEKPLGVDSQEAQRVCEMASRLGRRVYVGCVLRFSESLNTFRELLNEVGHLHSVRVECQSYLPDWRPDRPYQQSYSARPHEGGVLLDLTHEIDYAAWIFGWPAALQARVKNLGRLEIASDEIAELSWETPTGCLVSVGLDYLSRPARRCITAQGERGSIEWDGLAATVRLDVEGASTKKVSSSQTRDDMFLAQTRAFVAACEGTEDPRLATCREGCRALALCDAARLASDTRRETKVKYP